MKKRAKANSPWRNNGGARPNTGPKPAPDGKKVTLSISVSPTVKEFLETVSPSKFLSEYVLRSKQFRDWQKSQNN